MLKATFFLIDVLKATFLLIGASIFANGPTQLKPSFQQGNLNS
jgi:hypothetical protein